MRLFVALDLPAPVRDDLAAAQSRLRRGGHAVRWASVAGLHLTLQFLGEADPGLAPALLAALARIPARDFTLRLGGLGAFPSLDRPRVIWAGLAGDLGPLAELQAAVVRATGPLGFIPEDRPFAPHLTLGRARQDGGGAQIQRLATALRAVAPPAPLAWPAGRPLLYESRSTPRGVVYTALGP